MPINKGYKKFGQLWKSATIITQSFLVFTDVKMKKKNEKRTRRLSISMPIIFSLMLMKTLTKYIQFENSNLCLPQAITSRDGWEIIKKIGGREKNKSNISIKMNMGQ